jgi:Putative cyclase
VASSRLIASEAHALKKTYPTYLELPKFDKTGVRHAWGVFGLDDELGSLNWISAESVVAAAGEVSSGLVVNLSLPLTLPSPPMAVSRRPMQHHVYVSRGGRDDSLDSFYLQGSTQWDGLQHVRYREFGYWGGREEKLLDQGALGIGRMVEKGVVGRGVLIDVAANEAHLGRPIDPRQRVVITPAMLDETVSWEGVDLQQGDIVLLRTGWMAWYLGLNDGARVSLAGTMHGGEGGLDTPGLDAHAESAAWVWDNRIAAMAADNPALEALRVDPSVGFLHRLLIPLLGVPIGEFWDLEALSRACAKLGRYTFMLTSAPLNLPNGVGSPANAYAIL